MAVAARLLPRPHPICPAAHALPGSFPPSTAPIAHILRCHLAVSASGARNGSLSFKAQSACGLRHVADRWPAPGRQLLPLGGGDAGGGQGRAASRCQVAGGGRPPGLRVLDWYLVKEMVPILVAATALIATLGMSLGAMVELVREVVASGLPAGVALTAVLLQAPRFISLALPPACLAAALFCFGRMQSNAELAAAAAAGVPPWRLLVAPLGVAALAAALAFGCDEFLVPAASLRARELAQTALSTNLHSLRPREHVLHLEHGPEEGAAGGGRPRRPLRRVWYGRHLAGGSIAGLLALEVAPGGEVKRVVTAGSCRWNWATQSWELEGCHVAAASSNQAVTPQLLRVDAATIRMPGVSRSAFAGGATWRHAGLSRAKSRKLLAALQSGNDGSGQTGARQLSRGQGPAAMGRRWGLPLPAGGVGGGAAGAELAGGGASWAAAGGRDAEATAAKGRHLERGDWAASRSSRRGGGVPDSAGGDVERERGGGGGGGIGSVGPLERQRAAAELQQSLVQRDTACFSCITCGLVGAAATLRVSGADRSKASRAAPFVIAIVCVLLLNAVSAAVLALVVKGLLPPGGAVALVNIAGLLTAPALLATSGSTWR